MDNSGTILDNQLLPDETPQDALLRIREQLEKITHEYAAGELSSVQYYALYRHYSEKQLLIEKLIERNPNSDAWRAAATSGETDALRNRFEARLAYYAVFVRGSSEPLLTGGKLPSRSAQQVHRLLKVLLSLRSWRKGFARRSLGDGMWLLLTIGDYSMTMAVYFMQPSEYQSRRVRELHADFERANQIALRDNKLHERMVFPQRALLPE